MPPIATHVVTMSDGIVYTIASTYCGKAAGSYVFYSPSHPDIAAASIRTDGVSTVVPPPSTEAHEVSKPKDPPTDPMQWLVFKSGKLLANITAASLDTSKQTHDGDPATLYTGLTSVATINQYADVAIIRQDCLIH